MIKAMTGLLALLALASCSSKKADGDSNATVAIEAEQAIPVFNADSAYSYVEQQVAFGPRVPNTPAHKAAGEWLASELRRHGAEVQIQEADLKAFDGTVLKARNIIGQFNPESGSRTLLVAHWDCRPWADKDPDPANHSLPVDGANDGASGVGVLLEIARIMSQNHTDKGIDILFVDAEDWGSYNDDSEESWAMGSRYFATHPFKEGYSPSEVILLDMVGGPNALFYREYISQRNSPQLVDRVWKDAERAGYGSRFPNRYGSAVSDDHVEFIKMGIPAIDIIEFDPAEGFNRYWHTTGDNMDNIDRQTLKAVGQTVVQYIYEK